jgi:hypothetical protein
MSFIVKIVDHAGRATWLAREGSDGARALGSRKLAEVFQSREDAELACAKAAHLDGMSGMTFSVESAP